MKKISGLLILLWFYLPVTATNYFVRNFSEYNAVLEKLKPGDTLTMANGIWENVRLIFKGNGTEENPMVLTAETPGKVSIEGESCLVLSGSYLQVTGLLFTNGHAPGKAVISFAQTPDNPATHCRVTQCAVISYNQNERFNKDNWVAVYGKHNRIDHNYFAGKLNAGVTVAEYLNHPNNQDNHNRIDHNYFGERKRLGSNGGETMRLGTSTYSLVPSNTIVEDNYFEHCNGETEAVSIKATDNIIRRNVFFECEGSLVLRHGNNNQIYENYFIGNGKFSTAGLRIINTEHQVHDNYFFALTGKRFRAALAVMNGVPHSAINRYHQVKDVTITNNTFINCDNIEFCVGSDNERTAPPVNTVFEKNTIYQQKDIPPVRMLDDVSGIEFKENSYYSKDTSFRMKGFELVEMVLKENKQGIYYPKKGKVKKQQENDIKYLPDVFEQKRNAGPSWLNLKDSAEKKPGKQIEVTNNRGELEKAVANAGDGDTLILVSSGEYFISTPLEINKLLFIRSDHPGNRPVIRFDGQKQERKSHMIIKNGGALWIKGIAFDGTTENGGKTSSAIRTDDHGMINHYWLKAEDCEFYNFNESRYNAFKAEKGSFADSIVFSYCLFHTISGDAISLSAEKDDRGIYNAEYVILENCIFINVMGSALDLYRGGNDESTLGPFLKVNHCLFENVNNKELGSVLRLIGVQHATVTNSVFSNSGRGGRSVKFEETRWNNCSVSNCDLYNSGRIESFYGDVVRSEIYHIKPQYVNKDKLDLRLINASEFQKGTTIGVIYK